MKISILKPQRLDHFRSIQTTRIRRIFIVGASGAGKSILWRVLRTHTPSNLMFPTRFISRIARPDDDISENQHLGFDEFSHQFRIKLLEFYWPKYLPMGMELYGFNFCHASIAIYGCNNEFILNSDSLVSHSDLLSDSVVILVSCSPEERSKRLTARYGSHLVSPSELKYRMEAVNEMKVYESSDIVLENDTGDISATASELVRLLSLDTRSEHVSKNYR